MTPPAANLISSSAFPSAMAKQSRHPFDKPTHNSLEQGKHAFSYLIHPLPYAQFFATHFEQLPLFLKGDKRKFATFPKIANVQTAVRSTQLLAETVDVTSYNEEEGRATHVQKEINAETWAMYKKGCSIRLRRPQPNFHSIYLLCHHLESFFQCIVGANIYLTPPNSQGFAPHFDDVDVFICQLEGRKTWKVYQKRMDGHDTLPRRSSVDFEQSELPDIEMEHTLSPGDVLYLPRGYVHQAACTDQSSLHVTISMCQRWTWADFLLETIRMGIESAANKSVALRRTLPLRFGSYVGISSRENNRFRDAFARMTSEMIGHVAREYPVEAAGDAMMKRFMEGRLPPVKKIKKKSKHGSGKKVSRKGRVRLVEGDVMRVVEGDDGLPEVWYSSDNCKFGTTGEREKVTCTAEEAGALLQLCRSYPESVCVRDLELEGDEVELVEGLVEMGVVEVVQ